MRRLISNLGPLIMLMAGLGFAIGAVISLELGSFRRMGPGAFPLLVGGLLCILALIALIENLRMPMDVGKADPWAVLGVIGGVSAFAFLTPLTGVLPATAIAVAVTGSAIPEFRWQHRLALSIGVSIAVWLIFLVGLGIPLVAIRGL